MALALSHVTLNNVGQHIKAARRHFSSSWQYAVYNTALDLIWTVAVGEYAPIPPNGIPAKFKPVEASFNYARRQVDVKIRDGVQLHMIVIVPEGTKDAPILLDRIMYNPDKATNSLASSHVEML